jgi:hypothetical protein
MLEAACFFFSRAFHRSTAGRQRGVDGPVNRSPRSRRAARAGPADGSSRRCVDPTWFWFSSGSGACADKRRCGKDSGRSSSGCVRQSARFSVCSWFGSSDFLGSDPAFHIVQINSEGRVSGLAKKDGEFLSHGTTLAITSKLSTNGIGGVLPFICSQRGFGIALLYPCAFGSDPLRRSLFC